MDRILIPSKDIVARKIEGEIVIVPLVSGIGNLEDELFTLNETGRAVWERLDGKKALREIAAELAFEYDGPLEEIERDVTGLIDELIKRRMLVEINPSANHEFSHKSS
jgi:hypothetical protein